MKTATVRGQGWRVLKTEAAALKVAQRSKMNCVPGRR
jgi:hypothetical protein